MMNIFSSFSRESNDDVERSEISGKEKLKKFAFHLLSCFSPFTWKKIDFSSSHTKFVLQTTKFIFPECSLSVLVISSSTCHEIQLPCRMEMCVCVSQKCERKFYFSMKKKFIDGKNLYVKGERQYRAIERGNLIRWNCTFQIHMRMMIYLLLSLTLSYVISFFYLCWKEKEIDIMINIHLNLASRGYSLEMWRLFIIRLFFHRIVCMRNKWPCYETYLLCVE